MIVTILEIFIGIYLIGNILFTFWVLSNYDKSEKKEVPIKTMTIYGLLFGTLFAFYLTIIKVLK